ncbi:MAG: hypothetical protein ACODAD_09395 [Planctomycetota bacterium]
MDKQGDEPVREYQMQQTISFAFSIRHGDWKYLDHKGSGGNNYNRTGPFGMRPYKLEEIAPKAPGQLYCLEKDPGETTNLYSQHPGMVNPMKKQLEQFKRSGRSAPAR